MMKYYFKTWIFFLGISLSYDGVGYIESTFGRRRLQKLDKLSE